MILGWIVIYSLKLLSLEHTWFKVIVEFVVIKGVRSSSSYDES
jgi:hypothetical protein